MACKNKIVNFNLEWQVSYESITSRFDTLEFLARLTNNNRNYEKITGQIRCAVFHTFAFIRRTKGGSLLKVSNEFDVL